MEDLLKEEAFELGLEVFERQKKKEREREREMAAYKLRTQVLQLLSTKERLEGNM